MKKNIFKCSLQKQFKNIFAQENFKEYSGVIYEKIVKDSVETFEGNLFC